MESDYQFETQEGSVTLGFEFAITGKCEITPELTTMDIKGVGGEGRLYINDQMVGCRNIEKTVPFGWFLSDEVLCCGFDSEAAVSDLYQSPIRFAGDLERVIVP